MLRAPTLRVLLGQMWFDLSSIAMYMSFLSLYESQNVDDDSILKLSQLGRFDWMAGTTLEGEELATC